MRDYTKQPQPVSRTMESNPQTANQASISEILQRYKKSIIQSAGLEKKADIRRVEALTCTTPSERVLRNIPVNNNIVQRAINYNIGQILNFMAEKEIEGELKNKYNTLLNILLRMGDFGIADAITVNFRIVASGDLTPAYTKNPSGGNEINVFIEQWFFETADIGEIVAMVSHELGVHFLASKMMTEEEIAAEETSQESDVIVGGKSYKLPSTSGKGWKDSHGPNESQKDHIEMAREGSPRGKAYLEVVLSGIRQTLTMLRIYKQDHLGILKNIASQIFSYALDRAMSIVIQDQRGSLRLLKLNEQSIYACTLELIKAFPDFGDKDIRAAKEISCRIDMRTWLFDKISKGKAHPQGPTGWKAQLMSVATSIMRPSQKTYKLVGVKVESVIVESVRDELIRVNYPNEREIIVVDGQGWACYLRCVLRALNRPEIEETVISKLRDEGIDINGFGVEIGSTIENEIRQIIHTLTGLHYHVAAHNASTPGYVQLSDATGQRINLVLVGRHFCLLGNVIPSPPQEDIYRVWKM